MIFESHAHYDDERFDEDRETLLDSMQAKGISHIINIGCDMDSIERTIALCNQYSFIYGALGVHPHEASTLNEERFEKLRDLCSRNHIKAQGASQKVVAVGEVGLDYYYDKSERDVQRYWFERQIELANEVKLPIVIHSRDAAKETLEIMKDKEASSVGGVVHCYAYSYEFAKEVIDMGFLIGIGGVVTFGNAKKLKEVVERIPLDKILLETDSPYLTPVPHRGKRNSSLFLPYIAEEIGKIKGIAYEEVIRVTHENGKKLFQIS